MAVNNPFSITFGGQEVGGSSDEYQLHGPHVLDRQHDTLRVVFDVVVVGTSYGDLQSASDVLEVAFSKRLTAGESLEISLDGSTWSYSHGSTMLMAKSSISKTGNPDTDKGFSRAYTITIEAQLPASNDDGLRDIQVLVELTSSRQKIVTMRGTYTATSDGNAVARYQADFDSEATTYLTAIDNSATFELVDENYTYDRELSSTTPAPHVCNFVRQYVELLANQSNASLDDTQIRDHRITFTDLSQHPGDSQESIHRLRRVICEFVCSVDIDQTTDLSAVYDGKLREHIKQLFQAEFSPSVFCIEDQTVGYDETSKRISVSTQFLYQSENSNKIVEVAQSVAFREQRQIDYTYTHGADEFGAYADPGWATLERVWNRTVIVVGDETPKTRIAEGPKAADAGLFRDKIGGHLGPDQGKRRGLVREGWNIISNASQVTDRWVGDPANGNQQIKLTVLTESIVERYNRSPGTRTAVAIQRAITPGR